MHGSSLISEKSNKATFWNEYSQTMSREKLDDLHIRRLKELLKYSYENNAFYKELYDRHGVNLDEIKTLDDFKNKIPLTDKPMMQPSQREGHLYGDNIATDNSFIAAHYATSGTTGKPLNEAWEDYAIWRIGDSWCPAYWAAGIRPEDSFYFAYDFGQFAGFWSAYYGAIQFGATIISGAGAGMTTEKRIVNIMDLKPTVLVATPTYALHLANVAKQMGIDTFNSSIKFQVGAGEPGTGSVPRIRARMEAAWGCKCAEVLGISELPVVAPTCQELNGFHENEMYQFSWVRDWKTGKEVKAGEIGERIITSFSNYTTNWINYRSHDLVRAYDSCPCGCTWRVFKGGILGRTDNMITYKGTNIYQSAVEDIISSFDEASDYFQLILSRKDEEDYMKIVIEPQPSVKESDLKGLSERVSKKIKKIIGVTLPVEFVPVESLPRYEVKTKRVIDERPDEYKMELSKKFKTFE